jgi:hypothetical protein
LSLLCFGKNMSLHYNPAVCSKRTHIPANVRRPAATEGPA